jgi:hypothetical protein
MAADLIRSSIQYAIKRGIAECVISTFGLTGTDEEIDQARVGIMLWSGQIAPRVAEWVEEALRRAVELDTVIDTLVGDAMPAGSTETTPGQITHAVAIRKALAEMVTGDVGRGESANRIERVSAALVASLREPPDPPAETGDRGRDE